MAKYAHDNMLDGSLVIIKSNCNLMTVCKGDPATRSAAITSSKLADIAMDASDFTIANGSSTGRKVTVGAQNSVAVDASGSAESVCLVDGTRLLYKTTCTKQALTSGNKVNFPAWKGTIADPT